MYMGFSTDTTLKRISKYVDLYRNINKSLYKSSGNFRYPFEKVPLLTTFETTKKPNVVLIVMESFRAFESGYTVPSRLLPPI